MAELSEIKDKDTGVVYGIKDATARAAIEELKQNGTGGSGANIVEIASGSVVSISDSSDNAISDLHIFGKTIQNGTPSPDTPVPFKSVGDDGYVNLALCDKNLLKTLFNRTVFGGVTYEPKYNGWVTLSGTATGWGWLKIGTVYLQEGVIYKANLIGEVPSTVSVRVCDRTVSPAYTPAGGTHEFTVNKSGAYLFEITVSDAFSGEATFYPQLVTVSAESGHEPYYGAAARFSTPNGLPGMPVSSGGNYTDENGQQWICDELDFENGLYIKRVAVQNITSVSAANNQGSWKEDISQFMGALTIQDADITKPCMVTHGSFGGWFDNSTFYAGLGGTRTLFVVGGNREKFGDTVDSCNAYLSELNAVTPVRLLYALVTPIETALTEEQLAQFTDAGLRTVYPNTTITNDCGAVMEVKYVADTKRYIDNVSMLHNDVMSGFRHMPQMRFSGDVALMTKDNAVVLSFVYRGADNYINDPGDAGKRENGITHRGYAKVKWQGSSSIAFPKKNYTVTLYSDAECTVKMPIALKESWGAQSKYCMKANFIDPSQCRNVIAAKLWGKCVMSRPVDSISYTNMHTLPNAGAIDGYPIATFINDNYVGLYTMNIPKDEWMFGMADGEGVNVVLCGENYSDSTAFNAPAAVNGVDWDYEVEPADKSWVAEAFNKIHYALAMDESSESAISAKKAALDACLDIYSVIDYGIFIQKLCLTDNAGKNQLMATYDGVHWIMSAYDLDTAFGMHWSGAKYYKTDIYPGENRLIDTVRRLYDAKYNERLTVLNPILSAANVCNMIDNFLIDVPEEVFRLEGTLWPDMCGANTNSINQIKMFMMLRNS